MNTESWVIELLLPIFFNDGRAIPDSEWEALRRELVDRFGGFTAFSRQPAEGVWRSGRVSKRDDIVVVEVMSPDLDRIWWGDWRSRTEARLGQAEIIVRASRVERL